MLNCTLSLAVILLVPIFIISRVLMNQLVLFVAAQTCTLFNIMIYIYIIIIV